MEDRRVFWAIVGTVTLVLGVVFLSPRVQRELRPDPQRAFIAFEVEDEGVARPGPVEVPAGDRFQVHAVLQALGRGGRPVYFTQARALEIDGERIEAEQIRTWKGPEEVKVLWFSIEGPRPFVKLGDEQAVSELPFQAIFRPDWPRAWSIPGSVRPAREGSPSGGERPSRRASFGTQRYQVRLELFGSGSALVPVATFESPAPGVVVEQRNQFPTVVSALADDLALPSRVFGLTQIDMSATALEREATALKDLFDQDLAFSRLLLLRAMLDDAGVSFEALDWQTIDLAAGPEWGKGSVEAGNLLRAGERVVVLYQDLGEEGRLDYEDLCMDFAEGAQVRSLSDIFTGEGLVELADLAAR